MTKNYVCLTPYLSKHTSYDHVFVALVQNDDTSGCFFYFFKMLVFWVVRGVGSKRLKKGPKWRKEVCLIPYLRNSTSYDFRFWYTCVKWLYLQQFFFSFFQNSDFSGFSKFINKCQKEIVRCAPPSSHVCDFYFPKRLSLPA